MSQNIPIKINMYRGGGGGLTIVKNSQNSPLKRNNFLRKTFSSGSKKENSTCRKKSNVGLGLIQIIHSRLGL